MDGIPYRKLANLYGISQGKVLDQVKKEMDLLPENTYLSKTYCNRWSSILNIDGKYVKVKRFKNKIPFIYCLDFLTHDIPVGLLSPSENYQSFSRVFRLLKAVKYPLKIVICDDSSALKLALGRIYPRAKIQLCHNHYLENIRVRLLVRTEEKYQPFFGELREAFKIKHHSKKREALLAHITYKYARDNETLLSIMVDIERRKKELFSYKKVKHCPNTNNIIESYNSHLNGRLKTIKGFNSYTGAERWLNAWIVRRRTKAFTDCNKPFKHLNGKCSLERTLKKDHKWPDILGLKRG